jgi:hypothetical protein
MVILPWRGCYDLKNVFAEKMKKKVAIFIQNTAIVCQQLIVTMIFKKIAIFSAENCQNFDHNIT